MGEITTKAAYEKENGNLETGVKYEFTNDNKALNYNASGGYGLEILNLEGEFEGEDYWGAGSVEHTYSAGGAAIFNVPIWKKYRVHFLAGPRLGYFHRTETVHEDGMIETEKSDRVGVGGDIGFGAKRIPLGGGDRLRFKLMNSLMFFPEMGGGQAYLENRLKLHGNMPLCEGLALSIWGAWRMDTKKGAPRHRFEISPSIYYTIKEGLEVYAGMRAYVDPRRNYSFSPLIGFVYRPSKEWTIEFGLSAGRFGNEGAGY